MDGGAAACLEVEDVWELSTLSTEFCREPETDLKK